MLIRRFRGTLLTFVLLGCLQLPGVRAQSTTTANKRPLDYANGLVGTAPLDKQKLIGNAPPAGRSNSAAVSSRVAKAAV